MIPLWFLSAATPATCSSCEYITYWGFTGTRTFPPACTDELYEYAFNNYKSYKILDKNTYKVTKDNYYQGNLYIKKDVYLTLKEEETKKLINNIKLEKKRKYKNGDAVGENQIYLDDKLILTEKIYVKKENKYQPKISFWEKILNFFK